MAKIKTCRTGKKIYNSEQHAQDVITWAKRHRMEGKKIPIRCYYCEFCKYWHLTSRVQMLREEEEFDYKLKHTKRWIQLLKNQ